MMKLVNITVVILLIILAMLPPSKCSFLKPYQIDSECLKSSFYFKS